MNKFFGFFRGTKGKILLLAIPALIVPLVFMLTPRRTGIAGVVAAVVSSLVPLICLLAAYLILKRSMGKAGTAVKEFFAEDSQRRELDAVVFRQLVGCSRLAVLSSIYTDVVMLKKSRAGGLFKSHGIYKYVGKIEGGINRLEDCVFEMNHEHGTIFVTLPAPAITGHQIEKIEKFDESNSLFSRIENSAVMEEIQKRKTEAEQLLVEYGFLAEVESRAQEVVSRMIMAMGYKDYDIVFSTAAINRPLITAP